MLLNNLKKILDDKKVTIKDVVLGTNLSRNTLSNIVNNPKANVSNRTLDNLCIFLNVTPNDFFEYHPFNVECTFDIGEKIKDGTIKSDFSVIDHYNSSLKIKVLKGNQKASFINLEGICEVITRLQEGILDFAITIKFSFSSKSDSSIFNKTINHLSPSSKSALIEYMKANIAISLNTELKTEHESYSDSDLVSPNDLNIILPKNG